MNLNHVDSLGRQILNSRSIEFYIQGSSFGSSGGKGSHKMTAKEILTEKNKVADAMFREEEGRLDQEHKFSWMKIREKRDKTKREAMAEYKFTRKKR